MKIDMMNVKSTCIDDLKGGDVFYYEPSKMYWMKINEESLDLDNNNISQYAVNAISLDDGTLSHFTSYDNIAPVVNARITNL